MPGRMSGQLEMASFHLQGEKNISSPGKKYFIKFLRSGLDNKKCNFEDFLWLQKFPTNYGRIFSRNKKHSTSPRDKAAGKKLAKKIFSWSNKQISLSAQISADKMSQRHDSVGLALNWDKSFITSMGPSWGQRCSFSPVQLSHHPFTVWVDFGLAEFLIQLWLKLWFLFYFFNSRVTWVLLNPFWAWNYKEAARNDKCKWVQN